MAVRLVGLWAVWRAAEMAVRLVGLWADSWVVMWARYWCSGRGEGSLTEQ